MVGMLNYCRSKRDAVQVKVGGRENGEGRAGSTSLTGRTDQAEFGCSSQGALRDGELKSLNLGFRGTNLSTGLKRITKQGFLWGTVVDRGGIESKTKEEQFILQQLG